MMMMLFSSLSSCREKAMEALCSMHRTNPDSLRSCTCVRVFRLNFASYFFNLLLARFHQAEIIVVKHLVQECNSEAWVGVEPLTLQSWPS